MIGPAPGTALADRCCCSPGCHCGPRNSGSGYIAWQLWPAPTAKPVCLCIPSATLQDILEVSPSGTARNVESPKHFGACSSSCVSRSAQRLGLLGCNRDDQEELARAGQSSQSSQSRLKHAICRAPRGTKLINTPFSMAVWNLWRPSHSDSFTTAPYRCGRQRRRRSQTSDARPESRRRSGCYPALLRHSKWPFPSRTPLLLCSVHTM